MECWVPLFQIFLNSPCPETEASPWLQQSFNQPGPTAISTTSFLSLLTRPTEIDSCSSSSSPFPTKRVMWIQTLPNAVQARILSFLIYDRRSNHEWLSCFNLDSEEEQLEDEFRSLPDWLKDDIIETDLMLPWLPISQKQFNFSMQFSSCSENDDPMTKFEEGKQEILDGVIEEVDEVVIKEVDEYLEPQVEETAGGLKLCKGGGQSLVILGIIEPWRADDEPAAVLVSNLLDGNEDELGWPSHVLCSVILPKLLVLKEPASRVLLTAIVDYSKVHQKAAEYALLLPLMLRMEGINSPICDVITRIVRESLHPGHVSAFCQKLLSDEADLKKFICLPFHQCLIGSKLVWTESLFNLMQNILNHNIHFTQDSVDRLVQHAWVCADRFSKSLKFGKFLLCFVTKCSPMLKSHKCVLTEATQHTNTLVTKSVLTKLSSL
ncbi:putative tetraspanin-2-like [Capsicum annuum]|nr:putative tetraspanin-2-like [Capsicum annuum]